jgi:hypothetical protein
MFKNEYHQFQMFFSTIDINILSNFEKKGCKFDNKKRCLRKKIILDCFEHAKGLLKNHQFALIFEH